MDNIFFALGFYYLTLHRIVLFIILLKKKKSGKVSNYNSQKKREGRKKEKKRKGLTNTQSWVTRLGTFIRQKYIKMIVSRADKPSATCS